MDGECNDECNRYVEINFCVNIVTVIRGMWNTIHVSVWVNVMMDESMYMIIIWRWCSNSGGERIWSVLSVGVVCSNSYGYKSVFRDVKMDVKGIWKEIYVYT